MSSQSAATVSAETIASAHPSAEALVSRARGEAELGRWADARDTLLACLSEHPGFSPGFLALGRLLSSTGHIEEAISCFCQAAALNPGDIEAQLELAGAAALAGRHDDAAANYTAALARAPNNYGALNNLGLSLVALGRDDEAERAFAAALDLAPDLAEAHGNLGSLLQKHGRMPEALTHYRRAVECKPDWPEAWNNLGVASKALQDLETAERALRTAIRLRPDYVEALYNLGNTLSRPGNERAAALCYRAALELKPDHAEALYNLANASTELSVVRDLCERALEVRPDFSEALVLLTTTKLKSCDWNGVEGMIERILELVRTRPQAAIAPFSFLPLTGDPALQQQCARNWVQNKIPRALGVLPSLPAPRPLRRGEKLRIGYLSADFRNHAVGNLLVDVLAEHDDTQFELFGYSIGPDDGSDTRRRIANSMDHFVDARSLRSVDLGRRIRADGVHVLVDLTGHTEHSRTEVLALRPAPVQVSYLGFPGTLGASFADYVLVDRFLVPEQSAQYYDERLVYMPLCYQVSGGSDAKSQQRPRRGEVGLPHSGFVFCSFNNPYKIRPQLFDAWMRILARVPNSILWLAEFNSASQSNLRREAAARGVNPDRLITAPIVTPQEHSWRLGAADLFLDTAPYSAGATASQTLRAGVPLVTLPGESYVSRMAASLLNALGQQRLIAKDLSDYENIAVALAADPIGTRRLRDDLHASAVTSPLFDAAANARALEAAFGAMWQQACSGAQRGPLVVAMPE